VKERPIALVTGAGRRLGRAIALALGEAGYDLVLAYHHSELGARAVQAELARVGATAQLEAADLRDPSACEALVARAEARGPLSLLVNNAGILERSDADHPDLAAFERAINLNLRAPYLISCLAGQRMRERGGGSIVQIASLGGIRPYRNYLPYSLSKAGLIQLTRALAVHFAPQVRVNAIAPASVELPGEEVEHSLGPLDRIPLRRHARAADVTDAVLFAARTHYLTGQVLRLDGGLGIESPATDADPRSGR
jgi:pteridine reductase